MFKRLLFVAVSVLLITFNIFADSSSDSEAEVTIITINNARQTSYKKSDDTGNDTIVLEGSVSLSVQKGNSTNEITADKVTYDRKTEMLYAEGNVAITMKGSSSGGDTASATSLLLNTSTLEGVFDGGRIVQTQSDALNLPSGSTLIVFSEIFGKGSENVITFKNSSLTFCDEDPPHWHIDATRTWLLPGGEFAFFNALLYVGSVPVLYFPAFYYPKDELIFNPVFNYTKREGYAIQTTTYLYGRKPLDSTSSTSSSSDTEASTSAESLKAVYNFVKPGSLKEQKREGLVYHNLDEDFSGSTSQYVKVMADWYSNLGYMAGVDGKVQPLKDYISKLDFNVYLGFSNTLFKDSKTGNYLPYSSYGLQYSDESSFLGTKLPFRYGANLDFQLSKPFRLSIALPIYSDPFFAYDFKNSRRESMDWISYFLDTSTEAEKEPTITEISSFSWTMNSSYSPSLPDLIKPFVSSVSLSTNSSVNIASKQTVFSHKEKDEEGNEITVYSYDENAYEPDWLTNTPMRKFYYPSLVTPATVNLSMSGTIFAWPLKKKTSSTQNYVITMNKPDELKTDKQLEEERLKREEEERKAQEEKEGKKPEEKKEEKKETEEEKEKAFAYYLPDLEYSTTSETITDGITYILTYSVGSNITTQMAYASDKIYAPDDFDWNNIRYYMYTIKVPTSVSSTLNYGGSFFTLDNKLSYSPIFQKHPYMLMEEGTTAVKGGYTEKDANKLKEADYKAENRDVINTNTISLKPFTYFPIITESNVSWNSNIKLYRRQFTGTPEEPEWESKTVDWEDEECITVNSFSTDLVAKESNDFRQSLRFEMVMPPLLKRYTTTLSLTFPYVTASFSTGFEEVRKTDSKEFDKWKKSPFNQSLSVSLFNSKLKLSESYTYNMEDENHDSFKLSASAFGMQLSYVMSYVLGYTFNNPGGWKINEEKDFLPYSLSFSYTLPSKTLYKWANRVTLSPGLSTSVVADLLRPTNSYLLFSPSIKFKIHEFLDVTFSATSRNSVLYWYFHNDEGDLYSEWGGFPGNIVKDLVDSFRFDDLSKREASGFKLKSLNMTVSHDLHDWKFNMTMKIEPRLITENGVKRYDFSPYVTIGVVWNPMESMKTSIIDEYGEWKLE